MRLQTNASWRLRQICLRSGWVLTKHAITRSHAGRRRSSTYVLHRTLCHLVRFTLSLQNAWAVNFNLGISR